MFGMPGSRSTFDRVQSAMRRTVRYPASMPPAGLPNYADLPVLRTSPSQQGQIAYVDQNGRVVADGTLRWTPYGTNATGGALLILASPFATYGGLEWRGSDGRTCTMLFGASNIAAQSGSWASLVDGPSVHFYAQNNNQVHTYFRLCDDTVDNCLVLANFTNAQIFRIYNTTDAGGPPTNYERGVLDWQTVANVLRIGTENGGTGSTRNLEFIIGGTNQLDYGVTNSGAWTSASPLRVTGDVYVSSTSFLIRGTGTWANGSGANTATLTNSPVTGNPTKWIAIDDNGTTRHVPAW